MAFPLGLGRVACVLVEDPKLRRLMRANRLRVSFEWEDIDANSLEKIDASGFVPLENVPDAVWKQSMTAGFPAGRRSRENPTHYADLDEPDSKGQTLLDGDPSRTQQRTVLKRDGTLQTIIERFGKGVHLDYEDRMINEHIDALMGGVDAAVRQQHAMPLVRGSQDAGFAIVELMRQTR